MLRDQIQNHFMREFMDSNFSAMLKKNIQPFQELMTFYKCAIMEIETKFNVLNEQFSIRHDRNPIETIKTRLKTPEGIARKLKKNNMDFSIQSIEENITDVAGVRVICSFPQDIYMLAECLIQQDDIRLLERKDYIKKPKPSGYRSLHLIVEVPIFLLDKKKPMKVEVQLRTIAMDFWASLEHKLQYKKNIATEADEIRKELFICAEQSAALDFRMEEIKNRIARINVSNNEQ